MHVKSQLKNMAMLRQSTGLLRTPHFAYRPILCTELRYYEIEVAMLISSAYKAPQASEMQDFLTSCRTDDIVDPHLVFFDEWQSLCQIILKTP